MATMTSLDAVVPVSEQIAWVSGPLLIDGAPTRPQPALADDPYDDRLQLLCAAPEWLAFAPFLGGYIENAILKPFATQPGANSVGWWNLTVRDGAGRVQVNVGRQYAVIVDFRSDSIGEPKGFGAFYIDDETVQKEQARGLILPSGFAFETVTLKGYERGVVGLTFHDVTLTQIADLFNTPWLLRAVRILNLDLMRGGRLSFGWRRFHMQKLVDALFSIHFSEGAVEQPAPEATLDSDPTNNLTERATLAVVRVGHDRFAEAVLLRSERRCAILGIEAKELLQACHIKPWAEATDEERLDPSNGLCLACHLHAAFDTHLIGFAPDGRVVLSDRLGREDRARLKLSEGLQIAVAAEQRRYLEYRFAQFAKAQSGEIQPPIGEVAAIQSK